MNEEYGELMSRFLYTEEQWAAMPSSIQRIATSEPPDDVPDGPYTMINYMHSYRDRNGNPSFVGFWSRFIPKGDEVPVIAEGDEVAILGAQFRVVDVSFADDVDVETGQSVVCMDVEVVLV